ncbi:hypothetical protein [Mesorhizobium opportunistum]|uniref:Uncharacterized protein n=1 Tax=Mesorhizobium opportunistum (strain LMG 24607 / HAMBI 3007 / WSM2075) TaxID=536019 RepID=F7Y3K6_MESOW|nr:hypothetical protein [Mesorhizobium opportunistum]AEH88399.1 conserved hypothetical protein [Mesorhizobium opportunistum WSM2075]
MCDHAQKHRVLLEDPDFADPLGDIMEFRLTYAGPLYATQRDARPGQPPKATQNRHDIRRAMHLQLKRLWDHWPGLSETHVSKGAAFLATRQPDPPIAISSKELSARHSHYGFGFVPLVTAELDLTCSLDILFLRPDRPGDVVWGGDIDNRLKTFLDALRIPEAGENYAGRIPQDDEKPFFCLLEDDKLITRVAVDTDRLLEPINGQFNANDARLIVTVRIRPYEFMPENMHFG